MRQVSVVERRARLGVRHHLATAALADDVVTVAGDMVGLHATDPKTVFLSARARLRSGGDVATISRSLYEDRTLLRMLGMRRTMWVEPLGVAALVHAGCGQKIAERERRRLLQRLEDAGVAKDAGRWLRTLEESTMRALRERGAATATELCADVPRLATKILLAEGRSYETLAGISVWVLGGLAAQGRIVRGQPRGTWVSSQYRWVPLEDWISGGLQPWSTADAQRELVRRWLGAFGPGTVADLQWWTGLTARVVAAALSGLDTVEVELDGGTTGLLMADDIEPVAANEPWVALLPALDPTTMGWAGPDRDWYLGEHRAAMFDRNGNAGPTIWGDGRVVGGWAGRPSGEVAWRLLDDIGREASRRVEQEVERLGEWLGDVTVTPRFHTPLELELLSD